MPATFPRGRFLWHELLTTDLEAAAAFYSQVAGWASPTRTDSPVDRVWAIVDTPLTMVTRLGTEARRLGSRPSWVPYVAVSDVDATVRRAQGLGARVYVPPADNPRGRFAILADSHGAAFAVCRPARRQPLGSDAPAVGGFSWHELAAPDWRQAWEFYQALFAWEHAASIEMGAGNTYWMFQRAGGTGPIGGFYNLAATSAAPPRWLCYIRVPDADQAAETVARAGGSIVSGPLDVPGGDRVAAGVDPQGAAFAVHARAARPAAVAPPRAKRTKSKQSKPKKKPRRAPRKRGTRRR